MASETYLKPPRILPIGIWMSFLFFPPIGGMSEMIVLGNLTMLQKYSPLLCYILSSIRMYTLLSSPLVLITPIWFKPFHLAPWASFHGVLNLLTKCSFSLGKFLSVQSSDPTRPHKNGPWAWNTSLPRDKESSQLAMGLLPCVGTSFSALDSMRAPLFCLSVCQVAPGQSHYYICPLWGGDETLCSVAHEGCLQNWRDLLALGDSHPSRKVILPSFLSLSKVLFHPVLDCLIFLDDWYQDAVGGSVGISTPDDWHLLDTSALP